MIAVRERRAQDVPYQVFELLSLLSIPSPQVDARSRLDEHTSIDTMTAEHDR